MRNRFKRLRKDHRLMIKVCEIEREISKVCHELQEELGCFVGWSVARELAAGANLNDLIKNGSVEFSEERSEFFTLPGGAIG